MISPSGRYQIVNSIYEGSRTLVYRGLATSNSESVVLKTLRKEDPTFSEIVKLKNQYILTKSIDVLGIVKALALEKTIHGYILVMEDVGGICLSEYISDRTLSIEEFLTCAIALSQILEALSKNRIVHKDIKPSNILINPKTEEIFLTDFSIASLLPKETQQLQSPSQLEGSLAYISPEQTGRMNRGIDYRSDFYSLGVTFYELLTGQLPFITRDPVELVHCHIAKVPTPPHLLKPEIPETLSQIVMKLMAKNAEERYQSPLGLKFDLEKCLSQWLETSQIKPFKLAEREFSDRFIIPEKLYGRETEVQTLLEAFDRIANPERTEHAPQKGGQAEMMLVAGFSGIGKTSAVNEVHKPITRQKGYFIKGKFDQFNRNIPFSAFVKALRDLMGQLLSESDTQLKAWKAKILEALGDSGRVLTEVIPELEKIIGKQPKVSELSGSAARNRFNLLFQKFITVFTTSEHPLVIFLDDLQWADAASLGLMKLLLEDKRYLLLLGAYRDNEVSSAHPFILTVEELKQAGKTVNTITLGPLSFDDTNRLIADTLHCSTERSRLLTQLIVRKTKGNPFFTTQFLKALHEEGQITFDRDFGSWECDLTQVNALSVTDDVVEFMASQLRKMPTKTQRILQLAACIGERFALPTLAIVSEKSQAEAASDLWPALQKGLILPENQIYKFYLSQDEENANTYSSETVTYRFLHDRVQQAAYSFIAEKDKPPLHYKLGKLLLENSSDLELDERMFELVGHLNKGAFQLTEREEIIRVCHLNLLAGKKAKLSVAYKAGISFLSQGLLLLPDNSWQTDYDLTFSSYKEALECQYLAGNIEDAEKSVEIALKFCKYRLDKAEIRAIQLIQYQNIALYEKAIKVGLESLKMFDLELPIAPEEKIIQSTAKMVEKNLGDRGIADLEFLPVMDTADHQTMVMLLMNMIPPTYISNQKLMILVILEMTNLCLQYGNAPLSGFVYLWYGTVLCAVFGEYEKGDRFGELGLQLNEKANIFAIKGKVYMTFGSFVSHWRRPLAVGLRWIKSSFQPALEAGELSWCFHGASFNFWKKLLVSEELDSLATEQQGLTEFAEKKEPPAGLALAIQLQVLLNLQGKLSEKFSLNGETFNETSALKVFKETQYFYGTSTYYFAKAFLHFHYGDYTKAYQLGLTAEKTHPSLYSQFQLVLHDFYQALSIAQIYTEAEESLKSEFLERLDVYRQKFQLWADNCPQNYQTFSWLLEAEVARLHQNSVEAIENYDRAIAAAKDNKYLEQEALANELAAKFCLQWGKEKVAKGYMQDAYYCYLSWGALAKVEDLETRYPNLVTPVFERQKQVFAANTSIDTLTKEHIPKTSTGVGEILDLATLMKASRTLSEEIELKGAIANLMQVARENAGAETVALMLLEKEVLMLTAFLKGDSPPKIEPAPADASHSLPLSIINKVKHQREALVLDDASKTTAYAGDAYIHFWQPRSILCLPLFARGQFIGILYLENNRVRGAFTRDRVEVLTLLCSQAAISLENARLYEQSQNYSHQLQEYLTQLQEAQLQLVQNEKMATIGQLVAGIAHEINNPVGFIYGNLDCASEYVQNLTELLQLYRQGFHWDSDATQEKIEEIDLNYVLEDFPELISSMKDGTNRITEISKSMRTFSRGDTAAKVYFNIHEGIDSTLLILKHRLKANVNRPEIEVVKNYGSLPEVNCYPGQLNQVFMNLLANAIDAFEEVNEGKTYEEINVHPNRITITTEIDEDKQLARVKIADNGPGMSEEVKEKIFEHLFTTKGVGKGTGLGLSISRQIVVEKHGGTLTCNSEVGKGTQFAIALPFC